jgi:hypothetical protein
VVESELALSEDLYNSKYKDRLELSYKVLPKLLIIDLLIYNPEVLFLEGCLGK